MFTRQVDSDRDAERLRFLAEASHLLSSTLDYTETLKRLARLAVPRMADWCAIFIADAHGILQPVEVAHADEQKVELALEIRRRFPPNPEDDQSAYGVLRSGKPLLVHEITEEMLDRSHLPREQVALLKQLGLSSVLSVPLRARGRTFGVLQLVSAESRELFDEDDVAFAEELASRAAVAVDNARLFQIAKKRQKQEAALRRATEAVTASFSVTEIIDQIALSATEATDADGSYVERIIEDETVVVAVAGKLHPALGDRTPYKGSVAERVIELAQPEVIRSIGEHPTVLPGVLSQTHAHSSALFVPLIDGGEAVGALILLRSEARESFAQDEIQRAHSFGNLAALAFRRVHLLEDTERRREELEQVIKSRSRLMRGFTHDLKNPIGAADGHAALLEDGLIGKLTDDQLRSIDRIRKSLKDALQLINDLNEFARAESGHFELRPAPTQLNEIGRELAEQYRATAEQSALMLDLELNRVPIITTDDDRVRQIVGNLLSNAIKYTPEGGRVIVRTDLRANAIGSCVVIEIEDTGIGIPEDKQHLLFEEFARVDPSVRPGIGLGLAISRRVARALGGEITVQSESGRGSTFTLWLPGH